MRAYFWTNLVWGGRGCLVSILHRAGALTHIHSLTGTGTENQTHDFNAMYFLLLAKTQRRRRRGGHRKYRLKRQSARRATATPNAARTRTQMNYVWHNFSNRFLCRQNETTPFRFEPTHSFIANYETQQMQMSLRQHND